MLRYRYGAYLSRKQVADLVAPHPYTLGLVKTWLEHNGVPSPVSLTHGGNTLTLTNVSMAKANDLLGASYQTFRHDETNEAIVRTVRYALPAALHGHVQTVSPTTDFAFPRRRSPTTLERSGGAAAVVNLTTASGEPVTGPSKRAFAATPMYIRWLYKTLAYEPRTSGENVLAITSFYGSSPSPTDLTEFLYKYRADAIGANFRVQLVNGGEFDPSYPNQELSLDVQLAEAIAYPTQVVVYATAKTPGTADYFLPWLGYLLDQEGPPQTISTSYG